MQFFDFSISRFGAFALTDTGKQYPTGTIYAYEFEFYTEDHPGGSIADGVFRPVRKGYYSLLRPGQTQRLIPPFKGFFLNITTQNPELCDFFDHLPDTAPLWNMETVVNLIRQMMTTEDKASMVGRLQLQACVCQIISLLAQHRLPRHTAHPGALRHQDALIKVDRYIQEHPEEDLSLQRLAQISHLNPTYLHKLYTDAFGRTPAQRVLSRRIYAAKLALSEGILPLNEIAIRYGFSSQAYFCTKFRQVTGLTPTQYRNRSIQKT